MGDIQKTSQEIAQVQDMGASLMSVIERAARDPNVDIDKMERLLALQERVQQRDAAMAYNVALSEMQPRLPIITERGKIIIPDKNDKTKNIQETPYARWEDINEAIRPLLHEYGFALTFRTGTAADGKLLVTGILKHSLGHQEEATIPLPHDSSGSKNAVQAIGSSLSYGKRYSAIQLLNITTKGEDDDGTSATYMQANGEPQARTKLEGVHSSKSALRKAINEMHVSVRKATTSAQIDDILRAGKDTIKQAEHDWPALLNGDPKIPESFGLKGEVAQRRSEIERSPVTDLINRMKDACARPSEVGEWYIANEEEILMLTDEEQSIFNAEMEAFDSSLQVAQTLRAG